MIEKTQCRRRSPLRLAAAVTLALAAQLLGGTVCAAQPSAAGEPGKPFIDDAAGLPEYLAYAAAMNPGLRAAQRTWRAAVADIPRARALPDPRLSYSYYAREVGTRVGPQQHRIGLTQTFPWFGALRLRGESAALAAEMARQEYEQARLELMYRVKEAYHQYFLLGRTLAITPARGTGARPGGRCPGAA